jgi:uncharacterized protein with HEPN domain
MKPDDRIRLIHMAEALGHAIRFAEGRNCADLNTDAQLTFAPHHAIQIVGEAAYNISQETRNQFPNIPWPVIIGMRHRLVHAYADIDHGTLWTTATEAAPTLLAQIKTILEVD